MSIKIYGNECLLCTYVLVRVTHSESQCLSILDEQERNSYALPFGKCIKPFYMLQEYFSMELMCRRDILFCGPLSLVHAGAYISLVPCSLVWKTRRLRWNLIPGLISLHSNKVALSAPLFTLRIVMWLNLTVKYERSQEIGFYCSHFPDCCI